jgi:predicted ATP-dependent endonuclease of OLD family
LVGINECGKTTILQAIFCFDFINDTRYQGTHLDNCLNLYHTQEDAPEVAANIEISYSDLLEACKATVEESAGEENATGEGQLPSEHPLLKLHRKDFDGNLLIIRNLTSREYSIPLFRDVPPEQADALARNIIEGMPFILYNDDFSDRPPNTISIPSSRPQAGMSEWLAIYEVLFNRTNPTYSVFSLTREKDPRRRDSILSDVQAELNHTLVQSWKTFSPTSESRLDMQIKLTLNANPEEAKEKYPFRLEIQIVEVVAKRERFFHVVDRSKGFLWFYNFVMKLEYNEKRKGAAKETIYLLDEPGSYLHSSAQERLCKKIKSISENHGKVIYCTHSHHLLNPDHIPLNRVHIVEKTKMKNIRVIPLPEYKTKTPSTSAMQPIHEALQIPAFEFIRSSSKVVLVEGIYDKYAIQMFCTLEEDTVIFPSTGADAIIKNIQFLNAYGKDYVAIWDNDEEGRREYDKAKRVYGEHESLRFDLLPSMKATKRRMEEMFEESDIQELKRKLGCPEDASYERVMGTLYYEKDKKKKEVAVGISSRARERFAVLSEIIKKRLRNATHPT